jgi:hypothetical protein
MSSMSDFDAPKKPAWVGALVPVLLVLASAGLYWFLSARGEGGGGDPPVDGSAQSLGTKLVNGKTYYLFASLMELYPKNLEGENWDLGDGGPDIRYRVLWQGNEVFKSKVKDDSLIADWSGLGVELEWSDLLGKKFSPDEVIKGARVRSADDQYVAIEVVDSDVADNDEAGSVEILFKDLRLGTNEFKYEKTSDSAIRRVVLRVLPVDSSLQDLVNLMK